MGNRISIPKNKNKPSGGMVEYPDAALIHEIEKTLVLNYSRSQIEDSMYFLEKRGYVSPHRYGVAGPDILLALTSAGKKIIDSGCFLDEEQTAFSNALIDVKTPGMFGVKFNLGELWRRIKKKAPD